MNSMENPSSYFVLVIIGKERERVRESERKWLFVANFPYLYHWVATYTTRAISRGESEETNRGQCFFVLVVCACTETAFFSLSIVFQVVLNPLSFQVVFFISDTFSKLSYKIGQERNPFFLFLSLFSFHGIASLYFDPFVHRKWSPNDPDRWR